FEQMPERLAPQRESRPPSKGRRQMDRVPGPSLEDRHEPVVGETGVEHGLVREPGRKAAGGKVLQNGADAVALAQENLVAEKLVAVTEPVIDPGFRRERDLKS